MEAENKHLSATLTKLQNSHRQTLENTSHLQHQNTTYTEQIKKLNSKIDNLETELSLVRRRVIKQDIPLPVVTLQRSSLASNSNNNGTATTTTTGTSIPSSKKGEESGDTNQNGQLEEKQQELNEMAALASSRREEIAKMREEKVVMQKSINKMREELANLPLERISSSDAYHWQ